VEDTAEDVTGIVLEPAVDELSVTQKMEVEEVSGELSELEAEAPEVAKKLEVELRKASDELNELEITEDDCVLVGSAGGAGV
jgi:hypothetical protein